MFIINANHSPAPHYYGGEKSANNSRFDKPSSPEEMRESPFFALAPIGVSV
jgi:hypothetical protein